MGSKLRSKLKSAYLAAPIDLSSNSGFKNEVDVISDTLQSVGCSVFSPAGAWSPAKGQPDNTLQEANEVMLAALQAAVFVLPSVPTIGVVSELTLSVLRGSPNLLLVVDSSLFGRSWSLSHLVKQLTDLGGSVLVLDFGMCDLDDLARNVAEFANDPSGFTIARVVRDDDRPNY